MIKTIQNFKNSNFYEATATLFKKLNIAINEITTLSIDKNELFEKQVISPTEHKNHLCYGYDG